jgi:hypothetical protein
MEISEHIKIMMAKFVEEFPEARVNYGYDKMANVHVIEILPLALYKSKAFKDWQWNSCEEFLTLYPSDEIGFISEDAVVPLEKVDFSVQGTQYGLAETKPRHKASARYYSENYSRSPVVCEGETPYLRKQ